MPITLNGTTGIVSPALDSDSSLTVGPAVMDTPTGSAPLFAARAWVNFDGTKDTTGAASTANTNRLIRGSGNVTSVLRNGTGDYTITFTTAMPDVNYSSSITAKGVTGVMALAGPGSTYTAAVGTVRFTIAGQTGATSLAADSDVIAVAIFR
jgi:hypothetical protein